MESEDPDEMLGLSDGDGEVPRMPHMTIQRNRKANPELPETVTVLKTDEGCVVYLVGTAHFSLESQEDVAKVSSSAHRAGLRDLPLGASELAGQ